MITTTIKLRPPSANAGWSSLPDRSSSCCHHATAGSRRGARTGVPRVSEFGGHRLGGLKVVGGYGTLGRKTIEEFYTRYEGLANALAGQSRHVRLLPLHATHRCGAGEERTLFLRSPSEVRLRRIHAITSREAAYEKSGRRPANLTPVRATVAVDRGGCRWRTGQLYRYTTTPPASNWVRKNLRMGHGKPGSRRSAMIAESQDAAEYLATSGCGGLSSGSQDSFKRPRL